MTNRWKSHTFSSQSAGNRWHNVVRLLGHSPLHLIKRVIQPLLAEIASRNSLASGSGSRMVLQQLMRHCAAFARQPLYVA